MERNDCDRVEFEEMYGLCQWVGINVFYIVLFRLELVSSSNVIRFTVFVKSRNFSNPWSWPKDIRSFW